MTTAQPGQEQRMDELAARLRNWQGDMPDALKHDLAKAADRIEALTRPTADLGEDGELVARFEHELSITMDRGPYVYSHDRVIAALRDVLSRSGG